VTSTVAVSFDVVTELSGTTASSASELEETISASLTTNLATNVASNTDLTSINPTVDTSSIATVLETRNPSQAPYPAPTAANPVPAPVVESSSPSPTSGDSASEAQSESSAAGAIIGAVVGVVVLAGAGVALYFKVKHDKIEKELHEEEAIAMQVVAHRTGAASNGPKDQRVRLEPIKPDRKGLDLRGPAGVAL